MGSFTFSVVTFGCRVNQADSLACERDLVRAGGVPAALEAADLVVVNTCSVTAAADQAARQAIRRIARRTPAPRIIATGCYATRRPSDVGSLPGIVGLVPNRHKDALARLIVPASLPAGALGGPASEEDAPEVALFPAPGHRGRTTFPLRVQTGCDERCSYCSIPSTRGPSRSRPADSVLQDARHLSRAGYKEIVLTGVHLGAYGRDLRPSSSLFALLAALDRVPGEVRYRLSSLEPMDCSAPIVHLVAASGRFAPHFHLPLQHASDRLLAAMRRPYTLSDYRGVIDSIRSRLPDAAIGSDVIVGFPGESADDHEVLADFLRGSDLTHLHVFPYSDRPGTNASALRPKIGARLVRERCDELRAISSGLLATFIRRHLGQVLTGLTVADGTRVVTDNYLKVGIRRGRARNERVRVRLLSARPLTGEVMG